LDSKPEKKRTIERPDLTWNDNIKIEFKEIGCESVDWTQLAQNRVQWRARVNKEFRHWMSDY